MFIYLAVGTRIMVTTNLWTEVSLCNSSLGTVHNIVYGPVDSFPVAILVRFDSYSGQGTVQNDIVLILPWSST